MKYINKINQSIRSFIFFILFHVWTFIICIFILMCFWCKYDKIKNIPVIWAQIILLMLRKIVNIDTKINGLKNIPKDKPFILVSTHQSAWDTFGLCAIIKSTIVFVLKKELMLIPIFNICLKKYGCIPIKRGDKNMINNIIATSEQELNKNRIIGIFPQGTRAKFNHPIKCKSGVWYLYQYFKNTDFIPITIESGKHWAKGQFIKTPGTIKVTIHNKLTISRNENKYDFLRQLEKILSNKY